MSKPTIHHIVYLPSSKASREFMERNPNELAWTRCISPFIYCTEAPSKLAVNVFETSEEAVRYVNRYIGSTFFNDGDKEESDRVQLLLDRYLEHDRDYDIERLLRRAEKGSSV